MAPLSIQNLLNNQWRQTQLFYEFRLSTESAPVGDIHFTPGTLRLVMGGGSLVFLTDEPEPTKKW